MTRDASPADAGDLPADVLAALGQRPSPVAIVATVDADGAPRTAPFGSLVALEPTRLRFGCDRRHGTFANVLRDGRISVSLVAPRHVAVSIAGRACVVQERMHSSPEDAVIEIEVESVKDDWLPLPEVVVATALTVSASGAAADFMQRYADEIRRA